MSFSNEGLRELSLENLKGKLSGNSDKNFSNCINTCNTVILCTCNTCSTTS